ncbi:2-methylfumaryl-CoA isomerase [Palleronia aestuarii]|uniref:2-methylfumaryl-CoA isomerase n=1 Tax=Palleronia aestuarii TaxID=568105 RepID=A0A2W7N4V1_9RHOB|nr:CoA transferase [Palleronia aestuarii]PZX15100.1 2-methylfumaryl-CoA isomerase [Palleronia aestuarii]
MTRPSHDTPAGILAGLELVELSAFIAAPLAGLSLAQMGADVIRIDQSGGGLDATRWPLSREGVSLYWQGLNKGKRSVQLDLRREEGQRHARELIRQTGMVVTNRPDTAWLDYESLRQDRKDLIMLAIRGTHDNRGAIDYTIQARTGLPFLTGQATGESPVNQMLPAWDMVCGLLAASGLLAAERRRRETGKGSLIRLSLEDCALWMLSNLGMLAEAEIGEEPRRANGNDVFGAFGCDFGTGDGRRVMVAALSNRQWRALTDATGTAEKARHMARALDADLDTDAGRWQARDGLKLLLAPWFAGRDYAEVAETLDRHRVLWGPYQTIRDLVTSDRACSPENPIFARVDQPGAGEYLTSAIPLDFGGERDPGTRRAPVQGADTASVLAQFCTDAADV